MKKLTALLLLCWSFSVAAAIDALDFSSAQQEKDYHTLTQELRCPQCQNNNIADSNASIAVDMRAKVFELLQEGKSKQDIVNYMIERYGNFVTYNPPLTPATILLWALPALLLILGFIFLWRRKPRADKFAPSYAKATSELAPEQQQRLAKLLQDKE
ncbi:cytochrome c-type biogenesis protein [[Pasteurella] aerogenes]